MGINSESFPCSMLMTRQKKHLPLFLYQIQNLPSFLFYLQDYISMTVFLLNCFFQKTLNIPSYQFLAALPCTSHRLYSLCSLFWCGSGSKWLTCYDVTETHSQDPKCVFYLLNKESRVIVKNKSLKNLSVSSQSTIGQQFTWQSAIRLIRHTSLFKGLWPKCYCWIVCGINSF